MSKLTVKEYSTINQVSVQSVYKRIKSGSLETIEVNNIKYIIVDDLIDYERKFNNLQLEFNSLNSLIEVKDLLIDGLKEQIKLYQYILPKPNNGINKEVKYNSTNIQPEVKKKKKKDLKKKLLKKELKKLKKKEMKRLKKEQDKNLEKKKKKKKNKDKDKFI